jgi:hypothetical protein
VWHLLHTAELGRVLAADDVVAPRGQIWDHGRGRSSGFHGPGVDGSVFLRSPWMGTSGKNIQLKFIVNLNKFVDNFSKKKLYSGFE